MRTRQFCTPHLLSDGKTTVLSRVPLTERTFDEAWFQKLLFEHPSLIPVDEIEPAFSPLTPLARELQTGNGPIDLVYLNAEGHITLVETKLWRNPEARRQVVAQIIDYATAMSKWTYEDLCKAVSATGSINADPIVARFADLPEFDRARFIDTVSRGLTNGRFLLLIVGDGIQEGVEHLAEVLARTPHLSFSLALVEMAMFRTGTGADDYLIQPRTLARTREIVRAIVELKESVRRSDVSVTIPTPAPNRTGVTRAQSTEIFFESLAQNTDATTAQKYREFVSECEERGAEVMGKGVSLTLWWFEPLSSNRYFFGSVYANGGAVDLGWVPYYYNHSGIDPSIGDRYVAAVAALVPGSHVVMTRKAGNPWVRVLKEGRSVTIGDLLPNLPRWQEIIEATMREIEAAEEAKSAESRL